MKSIAPRGYYTAREAQERLGLNASTFRYYVRKGKIKRHVPPLKSDGFYSRKEIDHMAAEMATFFHIQLEENADKMVRAARPEDVQGIYDVLDSFGWQTAPIELRLSWYKINPYIDYVIEWQNRIAGYITAVPYRPAAMGDIMSGRRRAWHMKPEDIYPYIPGTYDLYVGIAVRRDIPSHSHIAAHLIASFVSFLEELAEQGIHVHKMYAVSAEVDGQKLCNDLGFIPTPSQPGDMFPRYEINLGTSDSRFAKLYREAIKQSEENK
jgi:hypothetical protein